MKARVIRLVLLLGTLLAWAIASGASRFGHAG